jgi:putative oxidoreductase
MSIARGLRDIHAAVFGGVERTLGAWFLGLAARFVFAAVLLGYYLNSALTKVGTGFPGALTPTDSAYVQILPAVMERVGYDSSKIEFFPYGLIVHAGTYAEFILPVLIVIGLFTRLASLGMISFVVVQTYVDIAFHGADQATIGSLFDRIATSAIADQRTLWVFVLVYLVLRGPGPISVDGCLGRSAGGRAA